MSTSARDYDLALYGAAGFTGSQAAVYLSAHAPRSLRWTLVGRNRARLEALRASLPGPSCPTSVLVADSTDPQSVDDFVRCARVVLSTVGPFALYGTPVVDACVRCRTHYVDISGEVSWIRAIISTYHDRAAADGTRIITCCGFDSVPSDLGTLLMVRAIESAFGEPCAEVNAYFQMYGAFNGGTVASALAVPRTRMAEQQDPFLLDPGSIVHARRRIEYSRDLEAPRYDPKVGTWIAPFFMAPTNTRVVRRSAALSAAWGEPYGEDFVYREAQKFNPPLAALKAHAVNLGLSAFNSMLRWAPTRRALAAALPKPGQGPSEATMDRGWFACELVGISAAGRQLRGSMRHKGDPGNRATVKFVCESALAVCEDVEALPGGKQRGGVLTPATGLGFALLDRLESVGFQIEMPARVTPPLVPAARAS